jgi:Arc/MetJ-type ribon-helix-helix transcriptional regulator
LPEDLERYVHSQVQCARFGSPDEAITEAVQRLRPAEPESALPRPRTEDEFKRHLLASGLMTSLPTPADPATRPPLPTVAIKGERLSETIIRERR